MNLPNRLLPAPFWVVVAILLGCVPTGTTAPEDPGGISKDPDDATACKINLGKIYEAIQQYRQKYKQVPNWLSDLYPEFIDDRKTFSCPYVRKINDYQTWKSGLRSEVFDDPHLPGISYAYEFCPKEYALWGGVSTTVREYKCRQMGVVGSDVPIVRCFAHQKVLNLSFGGQVFESETEWEEGFTNVVEIQELLPDHLFRERAPGGQLASPRTLPRMPQSPAGLLDLGSHYTSALTNRWWEVQNLPGNDLRNLPQGNLVLAPVGIQFDVRGLIQLKGTNLHAPFAESVAGIRVNRKCKRVHFLQGTVSRETPGREIGHYVVHYPDGTESLSIPIVYSKDVLDWWHDPKQPDTGNAQVAWEGVNPASKSFKSFIRLYHQEWENPLKDVEISSIDFVSAVTGSAPFLIAVTVE